MKLVLSSITEPSDGIRELTESYLPKEGGVEVIYKKVPHHDDPSHYGTAGFNTVSKTIIEMMIEEMNKMQDEELIMYSDFDILWMEKPSFFANQIGDNDMIIQWDAGSGPCLGFYILKINENTRKMMEEIAAHTTDSRNSQLALVDILPSLKLKFAYFPTSEVWNYGCIEGKVWNGESFEFPDKLKAFHANFTIGAENKKTLLKMAIAKYKTP